MSDGVPDDDAARRQVERTLAEEQRNCVAPVCETVIFSLAEVNSAAGFDVVLSKTRSERSVATNAGGPVTRDVTRGLATFEVFGFLRDVQGEQATTRSLPDTLWNRNAKRAHSFVLSDECGTSLEKTLEARGQWLAYLHGVFGRSCDSEPHTTHVFSSSVSSVPPFADGYARARFEFDRNSGALLSVNVTFEKWK